MNPGALSRVDSLASLSRRQLAQSGEYLVWRSYTPGQLILPYRAQLDIQGIVYRGKVQVATVRKGIRRVAGYIQAGEPFSPAAWTHRRKPVEFRAAEPTVLCLSPAGNLHGAQSAAPGSYSRAPIRHSDIQGVSTGANRLLRGALVVSLITLLGLIAWQWQAPWRSVLSELTYGLASLHLSAGRYSEAMSLLETSTDINPRSAHAYNDLGYLYYGQGRLQEAQEAFRRAVAADPALAVAYSNLGMSYLESGNVSRASAALRQAVDLNPESAAAWVNLGIAEQQAGRSDEAIRAYRAALRLDARLTVAQTNLGALYYERRMFAEAEQYLRMALEEQSHLPQARSILGAIALHTKDFTRAWNELQAAMVDLPDDPLLRFHVALWYEENGMVENARQEFDVVLALQSRPDLAALTQSHLAALAQP